MSGDECLGGSFYRNYHAWLARVLRSEIINERANELKEGMVKPEQNSS